MKFNSNCWSKQTKTIAVTSGKGGVGKSSLVANMAVCMGQRGLRVLLLDGDFGMANLEIMFGMTPSNCLLDVAKGPGELYNNLVNVADNIQLIPGGSGVYSLHKMNFFLRRNFMDQINELDGLFDIMLIDTPSGLDDNVLYLTSAAQRIVVVVTPEPSSLTDAYALMKVLHTERKEKRFSILCNEVRGEEEAKQLYSFLLNVSSKFLCVNLNYLGYVPCDKNLRMATKSQQLISRIGPSSPSSLKLEQISRELNRFDMIGEEKGGLQFFWQQMVEAY